MKAPLFYSKILLFGEYGIIEDSKGLSIPFNFFKGGLRIGDMSELIEKESNLNLTKFRDYLLTIEISTVEFDFEKLNLDFTLAQIDKLFQAGQTKKAKAALSALVTLVSKGAFGKVVGAATGPFGTAAMGVPEVVDLAIKGKENIIDPKIVEPAAAKMVEGENRLENFLKGKIPSFEKGGPVDMPGKKEEVSSDFIAQAEIALKNAMREKGSSLTESEIQDLAFQLANPSKKVSDPSKSDEYNIKIFEDKVNKIADVLTMVEGSAVVDLNKKDRISDDVLDFMKRGMNKFKRMLN